jgi:hypothetical protein
MPSSFNSVDVYTILCNRNNCNSPIDVCCNLISFACSYLKLVESFKTLSVLSKNGVVPAPFVDVTSKSTPKGRLSNSRILHCSSQSILIPTAEAESCIGDVPGAFNWLMLSHECLSNSPFSLNLKSLLEPVDSSILKIIQICLAKVALITK